MKKDTLVRYSLAFKQQIVSEVESGRLTAVSAEKIYDVSSASIYNWMKELGKGYLARRRIRVETLDEVSRLKELERCNRELESALARTQVKVLALESLIETAEGHFKVDFKKNFGPKESAEPSSGNPA